MKRGDQAPKPAGRKDIARRPTGAISRRVTLRSMAVGLGGVGLGVAVAVPLGGRFSGAARAEDAAKAPKYYFRVSEVTGPVDEEIKTRAAELLSQELQSRPAFTTTLGGAVAAAADPAAVASRLKKRGLRGFDVSLQFEEFKKELRDPRPGGRLKQLALSVSVSLFGAEIPDKKIAFSGQGSSMQIAEVFERKLDEETSTLMREVLADALRQAVDQAVLKLNFPPSVPLNEAKGKRARRGSQKR